MKRIRVPLRHRRARHRRHRTADRSSWSARIDRNQFEPHVCCFRTWCEGARRSRISGIPVHARAEIALRPIPASSCDSPPSCERSDSTSCRPTSGPANTWARLAARLAGSPLASPPPERNVDIWEEAYKRARSVAGSPARPIASSPTPRRCGSYLLERGGLSAEQGGHHLQRGEPGSLPDGVRSGAAPARARHSAMARSSPAGVARRRAREGPAPPSCRRSLSLGQRRNRSRTSRSSATASRARAARPPRERQAPASGCTSPASATDSAGWLQSVRSLRCSRP